MSIVPKDRVYIGAHAAFEKGRLVREGLVWTRDMRALWCQALIKWFERHANGPVVCGLWFVILKRSFAEVYNGLWGLLRREWFALLVFFGLRGIGHYVDVPENFGSLISFGFLVWLSWSWHRAAAADGARPKALKPEPLIKYTLDFFLIGLVAIAPVLVLSTVIQGVVEFTQAAHFDYGIERGFDTGAANEVMSNFQLRTHAQFVLAFLPIIATALVAPWVALRVSLVLPTRARGQDMGFRESWRASKSLSRQILFLGIAANAILFSAEYGVFVGVDLLWESSMSVFWGAVFMFAIAAYEVLSAVWIASLVLELYREVEARAAASPVSTREGPPQP